LPKSPPFHPNMMAKPMAKNPIDPIEKSIRFFMTMLQVFFARVKPDSTSAKPACMRKTRKAAKMVGITEDHARILDRYQRMRSASLELNNTLMDRYKPPVKQAAEDLGVLVKDTIVLDMDQMPVLMDYAIHHCRKGGRNVVDRFAETYPPEPGSDAEAVLTAMQQAFFSLFQVRDVVEDVGVHVTDILRNEEHFLADVNLSQSTVDGVVLASRMLPFEGFIMTTGAALPVEVEVLEWIVKHLEEAGLSPSDVRNMPEQAWSELEAMVIGACLLDDQDQQIRYEDVPGNAGPPPIRNESDRVGRNDPCPCGSGKKYKKCCGR
jgi:hypothetical protein